MTEELKVGDKVAVDYSIGNIRILTVERLTATQYVCTSGLRLKRETTSRNGMFKIVGASGYSPYFAQRLTPELHLNWRIQRAANALRLLKVSEANVDEVEAFCGLIKVPA